MSKFRIRTLLFVIAVIGCLLAVWIAPSVRQQRAVRVYRDLGLGVQYADAPAWIPESWVDAYPDYFCKLTHVDDPPVNVSSPVEQNSVATEISKVRLPSEFSNPGIAAAVPNVTKVFSSSKFDATVLEEMAKLEVLHVANIDQYPDLPNLKHLMVIPGATEIDCGALRHFPNIKYLAISSPLKEFKAIANCQKLESIIIGTSTFGPKNLDLRPLAKLSALKGLMMNVRTTSDLSSLAECDQLERVMLTGMGAKKIDLRPLLELPRLKCVELSATLQSDDPHFGMSRDEFESKRFAILEPGFPDDDPDIEEIMKQLPK